MLEHLKVHSIEKMKIFRGLQRAQVSIPGWNYAQQWVEGERNDLRCEYFHIPKATLLSTGITQTSLGSLRGTLLLKGWKKKCWCCNGPNWYSNVNPRANSQQLFLHPSLLPYFPKVFVGSTGMALVFFLGGMFGTTEDHHSLLSWGVVSPRDNTAKHLAAHKLDAHSGTYLNVCTWCCWRKKSSTSWDG